MPKWQTQRHRSRSGEAERAAATAAGAAAGGRGGGCIRTEVLVVNIKQKNEITRRAGERKSSRAAAGSSGSYIIREAKNNIGTLTLWVVNISAIVNSQ